MKKIIVFLFIIMVILVIVNDKQNILIPDDAIRFRVIANSNSIKDQTLKLEIKNTVEKELYKIIGSSKTIEEARLNITNNMDEIKNLMNSYNVSYDINFGNNYFPTKEYKGINYEAGNYESLVITLGTGLGDNWWCVLFPPLCLLDEKENIENVEYKVYAQKIINKFIK